MFPLGDVPIQISLVKVPTTPQPQVARLRNAQATLPHPQQQYNSTNRKVLTHYHNMQRALHLLGAGIGPLCRSKPLLTVEILRLSRTRGRPHFHYRHHDPRPRAAPMYAKGHESSTDADADVSVSSAAAAVAPPQPAHKPNIRYCQSCGGPTNHVVPNGEEKVRAVCTLCGKIHYENPKMVVGCLVEHDGKVLLCKRSIEPSYGLWTLPAGYLEIGESATEGAIRETMEEACAHVEVVSPFAQLDIPRIGQSYVIFRAKLTKPEFSPGPESSECALFSLDDIPLNSLAFSSIFVTLKLYIEDTKSGTMKFHYCTINKRPGASPSDPSGFSLDCHLQS